MWSKGEQKYNRFVWKHQGESKPLKSIIQEDMGASVRFLCDIKKHAHIDVDGQSRKFHELVQEGQIVTISLQPEQNAYKAERMKIHLLYEDEDLMIVQKPPYMVVHPTKGHPEHTLLNGLIDLFQQKNIYSKIRFINRLDRDTSGILSIAKNAYCHSILTRKNAMHSMEKIYHAVIEGKMSENEGRIDLPILKSEDGIRRMVHEEGQQAVTYYQVIENLGPAQLLQLRLETGRTHQIRVHFSHLGHPLLGDELYGGNMAWIQRQALHCVQLGILSPRKKEKIFVHAKLPQDMRELVERLRNY